MDFPLARVHYQRQDAAEIARLHAIAAASYQNVALREEVTTMSQAVHQTWAEWAFAQQSEVHIRLQLPDRRSPNGQQRCAFRSH